MSCWERKVREKIVFSYYFSFRLFSLYFIFLYDKNLREKEGWLGGFMLQWVGAWWSNFRHDLIMFWWEKKKKRRSSLKFSFRTLLLHKSWDFFMKKIKNFSMRKIKKFFMKKIRHHKIWKLEKYLEKKVFSCPSIEMFSGHQSLMYWNRRSIFS